MTELTVQQHRVARLIAECAKNSQIAAVMGLSVSTIEGHITEIAAAWNLDSEKNLRAQIVRKYLESRGFPRRQA